MRTRYVAEVMAMMFLGMTLASLIAWGLEVNSPLTVVWGALYGFFSYVVWRIIIDQRETVREEEEWNDLVPLQAFFAFFLPIVVVLGFVVLCVVGLLSLAVMHRRGVVRPNDF